jgi:AcrR family transcriptional regulator
MARQTTPDAVLDAALACLGRVGLTKTTLDDVAREAGCARATVYRYFGNKQALIAAVVSREIARLQRVVLDAADAESTLADAVTAVITSASDTLQHHNALVFVATYEPEVLLPYLAFEAESAVLGGAAELVAPAFTRFMPIEPATRLAEWVARLTLSYLCCPSEHLDVNDARQVRALVDDFVLPGFSERVGNLEGANQ